MGTVNTASLKDCSHRSLRELEKVAGKEGRDQIQHMVRDERQVRVNEQIQG